MNNVDAPRFRVMLRPLLYNLLLHCQGNCHRFMTAIVLESWFSGRTSVLEGRKKTLLRCSAFPRRTSSHLRERSGR